MKLTELLNELETPSSEIVGLSKEDKKLNPAQWATAIDKITRIFQDYEPLKKFKINAKLTGSLVTFKAGSTVIGKINVNQSTIPAEKLATQLEEIT